MSQTYEHSPGDHEDPAPGMTWMMGIIGLLILVVIYFGITAVYRDSKSFDDADKFRQAELPVESLERAAREQLQSNTWMTVENAEGEQEQRLTIPIDRSMDLIAEQLRRDQSASIASPADDAPALASKGE